MISKKTSSVSFSVPFLQNQSSYNNFAKAYTFFVKVSSGFARSIRDFVRIQCATTKEKKKVLQSLLSQLTKQSFLLWDGWNFCVNCHEILWYGFWLIEAILSVAFWPDQKKLCKWWDWGNCWLVAKRWPRPRRIEDRIEDNATHTEKRHDTHWEPVAHIGRNQNRNLSVHKSSTTTLLLIWWTRKAYF